MTSQRQQKTEGQEGKLCSADMPRTNHLGVWGSRTLYTPCPAGLEPDACSYISHSFLPKQQNASNNTTTFPAHVRLRLWKGFCTCAFVFSNRISSQFVQMWAQRHPQLVGFILVNSKNSDTISDSQLPRVYSHLSLIVPDICLLIMNWLTTLNVFFKWFVIYCPHKKTPDSFETKRHTF